MHTELDKVVAALKEFYAREAFLFEHDLGERALTHRLALHVERQFPDFEVDCDFDRARAANPEHAARLDRVDRRSSRQIDLPRYRRAPAQRSQQSDRD